MKYWIFIFELFLFLSNCYMVSCNICSSQTIDSFYSDSNPILSSSSSYLSESISRLYPHRWEFDPYRTSSSLSSSICYSLYTSLSFFILLHSHLPIFLHVFLTIFLHIFLPILLPILYPDCPSSNSFDFLPIFSHFVKQGNAKTLPDKSNNTNNDCRIDVNPLYLLFILSIPHSMLHPLLSWKLPIIVGDILCQS